MSATRSLAALAFASAALHGLALQLRYLLRSDLASPVGVLPPSLVAFVGYGLAAGVGTLGARRLVAPGDAPSTRGLAVVGGGALLGAAGGHLLGLVGWPVALLGVGPSLFGRAVDPFVVATGVAMLGSAVFATVACLAGAVAPRVLADDGRRLPAGLATLTLLAGLVAGVALFLPVSRTLAPNWRLLPWWMYGAFSGVVVPLSVVAVARSRSAHPTLAPTGVAVLLAGAFVGYLLGGATVVGTSMLVDPGLPLGFYVPPTGLLWVDIVVGAVVVGLGALAGLSTSEGTRTNEGTQTSEDRAVAE